MNCSCKVHASLLLCWDSCCICQCYAFSQHRSDWWHVWGNIPAFHVYKYVLSLKSPSLDVLLSSLCIISQAKLTHPGKIVQDVVWCWEQLKSCRMMGLRHSWIFLIAVEKSEGWQFCMQIHSSRGEVDDSAPYGRSHSDPDTLHLAHRKQQRTMRDPQWQVANGNSDMVRAVGCTHGTFHIHSSLILPQIQLHTD